MTPRSLPASISRLLHRALAFSARHPRMTRALQIAGIVDATRRAATAGTTWPVALWAPWVLVNVWILWVTESMRDAAQAASVARYEQHSRGLKRSNDVLLKFSLETSRRAKVSERAAIEAEGRAVRAHQTALQSQFILEQNVDGFSVMSGVVMTHLRRIGGESAVIAVKQDLDALERSKN